MNLCVTMSFPLFMIVSIDHPDKTIEQTQSVFEISQALQDLNLSLFMEYITYSLCDNQQKDGLTYERSINGILKTAGLKTKSGVSDVGTNLAVRTENAHFVFEFTINNTPSEALARIENYKNTFFFRDKDVFCVGIDFQDSIDAGKFRCNWMADLYSEIGILKKSLPERRIECSRRQRRMQQVNVKHEPVPNSYNILEKLDSGGFGNVYKCIEKTTGNIFAAKFILVTREEVGNFAREEIEVMNRLHHPKLLPLHEAFEYEDEIVLIVEILYGENLHRRFTTIPPTETEAEAINYVRQICEAIKHMHERNIIHLDIRLENVVCQTKISKDVKLIDFGLARVLDDRKVKMKACMGAREYAAPEILENRKLGFYTDMWSLGVLTYFLLGGFYPFYGEDKVEMTEKTKGCVWDFDDASFRNVSSEGKDFIKKLLIKNTRKRMTAQECLNHPWLRR